jgi:hypothetical protein
MLCSCVCMCVCVCVCVCVLRCLAYVQCILQLRVVLLACVQVGDVQLPRALPFCIDPSHGGCVSVLFRCSFAVCAGQVADSVAMFSKLSDPLDVLELTLRARHLAPIAPDSLGSPTLHSRMLSLRVGTCERVCPPLLSHCSSLTYTHTHTHALICLLEMYPFKDSDPFILRDCPHVYACGGQSEYASKVYSDEQDHKVRLIAVPSFYKTGVAVLVNIHTLDAQPVHFNP